MILKKYFKIFYLLVLFVVLLVHLSYIPNEFVWLDHGDIASGRVIKSSKNLESILFTRFGETGFYRPLISFAENVDFALFKDWAPGYHLTNIVFHLIVVALVPLFFSVFFRFTIFENLLVMLIVGVHPFTWLPVGAISYRPELLLAIFVMLTVYLHAKARVTGKSHFEFFAVISFFLGLLSKETALFLIPALIFSWELLRQSTEHSKSKPSVSIFLSEFSVVALYVLLRIQAVPEIWRVSSYDLSLSEAIGTRFSVLSQLLLQFFIPLKPDLSDAVLVRGIDGWMIFFCFPVVAFITVLIKKKGFFSSWSKALLLFGIMLLPALGIIPVPRFGSPHYGYVALLSFAALVVLGLRVSPVILKKIVYALCVVWICIMSYVTFMSGFQFKNDLTLFAPEVKKDPYFLEGYFYLGNYYLLHKDLNRAEEMYKKALKSHPKAIIYNEKESILFNLKIIKEVKK